MMNMVGIELTNFVNPNLTWKTVSKGNRSATRRSRKPASRSPKVDLEQADKSPKREDTSVSESEKVGVAVLGRRFGDKVEHVPIKKRRFLFRSPSPPPSSPSPHFEESEQILNCHGSSVQLPCPNPNSNSKRLVVAINAPTAAKFSHVVDSGSVNEKVSVVTNEKSDYCEEFSGIEILAAAACNDSISDDIDIAEYGSVVDEISAREGIDASSSSMPSKEGVASLCSRDDRSHWDLNTVMDAWEQPCGDQVVDPQTNVTASISDDGMHGENLEILSARQEVSESGDCTETTPIVKKVVSPDVHGATQFTFEMRNLDLNVNKLDGEKHELAACYDCDPSIDQGKCVPTSVELALKVSNFPVSGAEFSDQVVGDVACPDISSCSGSDLAAAALASEENRNSDTVCVIDNQNSDHRISSIHLDKTVRLDSCQSEEHDFACPNLPVLEKAEGPLNEDYEDSERGSGLRDSTISLRSSANSCQLLGPDELDVLNPECESGDVLEVSHSSPKCENLSASKLSVGEGLPIVTEDAGGEDDKRLGFEVSHYSPRCGNLSASNGYAGEGLPALTEDAGGEDDELSGAVRFEVDLPVHLGCEGSSCPSTAILGAQDEFPLLEACKKSDDAGAICTGKMSESDFPQEEHGHLVGVVDGKEFQEGYDSQFEDGELREESVMHCWEDSLSEDGETERVEYESDNGDVYDVDTAVCSVSFENNRREACAQPCIGGSSSTNIPDIELRKTQTTEISKMQAMTHSMRNMSSETLEMDMKVEGTLNKESTYVSDKTEHFSGGNVLKESIHLLRSRSKTSADTTKEVNDGCKKRDHTTDCMDVPDVKDISVGVVGLRESRRELPSHIDSSSDVLLMEDSMCLKQSRSNNFNDSYAQADKSVGQRRPSLHMRGRSRWDDHSSALWDSKNRHFSSYDGPFGSRKPRPKSIIVNSASKVEDSMASDHAHSKARFAELNCRPRRPSVYPSSKGVYRPFIRRRSSLDRDDDYNSHMGIPVRDINPDRTRDRSGRYPQGLSPREGHYRSLPDDSAESFVQMSHHFPRRERSFSPVLTRGAPHFPRPHERYRSRSRSRSPFMRQFARERNTGLRPLSRSPEFRSEDRVERLRLPIQKPSFASDYEVGFMSPPRSRFSLGLSPREGYYRSLPDDPAESFVRMPHHFSRREQSFSPVLTRGAPHFPRPHERYRLRSRSHSRSPFMRPFARERNTALRPPSRSPEFRSEDRVERLRLPIQKPSFASDYEVGFMSPPRNRFSPQRNPRWLDDRNCAVDEFRDRRSPARMFRQNQRFSSPGSPGQKPNECFRPNGRSGRFPEMACAVKGRKYDGSDDDRRKHGNRYEIIHPVRRYVTDGGVRRFQYDVQDCFVEHDSRNKDDCIRSTDRRHKDIPRRSREEKNHIRYNHDRM